jgi:ABC-type uncharacterized transport system involved in gliding motility auxiliary subunit
MNKRLFNTSGILIAVALFISVNVFAGSALRFMRIDLTENGLYTLSKGTRNILSDLDEPIALRFFFSKELAQDYPGLQSYSQRVQELLEEYVAAAGGMLTLSVVEPEPFSEAEDQAVGFGLQGAPVNQSGDRLYFGLAATNSVDEQKNIAFFDERREEFLEYDLTEVISNLANFDKQIVGIMSSLPLQGAQVDPRMPPEQWIILQQIEQLFEIRTLDPASTTSIDPAVDVLMIVHPKQLPDSTLFAIDQFALSGGRILAFVDPFCDVDPTQGQGGNPMSADKTSNLDRLFEAWGIELVAGKLAGDMESAEQVMWRSGPVAFLPWLEIRDEGFSADDFVTSDLENIKLRYAGILRATEGASTSFEPLMRTGTRSMEIDAFQVQFGPDPERLLNGFIEGGQGLVLAARLSGDISSAFPEGKPAAPPTPEGAAEPTEPDVAALGSSVVPLNAIVIADADMLHQDVWAQVQNFLGQRMIMPLAKNGDFVINCLENLGGNNDLISLRSRGRFNRPFEKKRELEREADERFRAKQQELEARLRETETRLSELQQQKEGSSMILSPEQQAEIERFQEQRLETRKELREVQHQLQRDIDRLGSYLKFVNIGLVPALIGLAALAMTAFRSKRS